MITIMMIIKQIGFNKCILLSNDIRALNDIISLVKSYYPSIDYIRKDNYALELKSNDYYALKTLESMQVNSIYRKDRNDDHARHWKFS